MPEMQTEVIDREGRVMGVFRTPKAATDWAQKNLPGEQNTSGDYEKPNGWDIRRALPTD